jgi:DNA (cytosine-5)-methyltransferase 1
MNIQLVLSLFPGIGLLDQAFEEQGFCVVRGPDLLWGGDIKKFHPPSGKFDGVIGGPPCKPFSQLAHIVRARYGEGAVAENLIPEFERCITETKPSWFLMENTPRAPLPKVDGYAVCATILNNRSFGSPQNRVRRFSFGVREDTPINLLRYVEIVALENPIVEYAVLAGYGGTGATLKYSGRRKDGTPYKRTEGTLAKMKRAQQRTIHTSLELQGLPRDLLDHAPFTKQGKFEVVGNGVPLPMGRAIARAVKNALIDHCQSLESKSPALRGGRMKINAIRQSKIEYHPTSH